MSLQEHVQRDLTRNLDWITTRRWFGDKARPVKDVQVVCADEVEIGSERLLLIVARFAFEWGADSTYFVPLLGGDALIEDRDATRNATVLEWLIDGFAERRDIAGTGTWRWRTVGTFPDTSEIDYAAAKPISGEQSNTSIVFPGAFIGKVFRRVAPGLNPDLEIAEHLTRGGSFTHAPELFGVVDVEIGGERIDLLAIQEFVPNVGDGWTWLLGELADPRQRQEAVEAIRVLGTRTGELHIALSDDGGNPDFAPVEIGEDEAQAIIRRVIGEMEGSVEGLTHHLSPAEMTELHAGLGAMMGDAWSMVGTLLTRVHGDYHLGQTLRRTDGDFEIIDFEGEPSRSMDERRMKLPPLKDVAGMVRSLEYAGATLIQATDDPAEHEAIQAWVRSATDAYVDAYKQAISATTVAVAPKSDDAFQSVLNLMVAEKALYETRYEMNNRPDWLWIPLGALKRLVGMDGR